MNGPASRERRRVLWAITCCPPFERAETRWKSQLRELARFRRTSIGTAVPFALESLCYNLPAHNVAGIEEAINAAGATLRYLPKYSPDLNPIELPYSKFKAYLRNALRG